VHLGNRLKDTVFILGSLEAVMFDVVDQFKKENTPEGVDELILN